MTIDTIDARPSTGAMHESASAAHHHMPTVARALSVRFETTTLILVDAIAALLAVLCGLDARFGGSTAALDSIPYPAIAAAFPGVWVMTMAVGGVYDRRFLTIGPEEYRSVLNAAVWLGGIVAVASYLLDIHVSRGFVAITMPLSIVLTLTGRYVQRQGLHSVLAEGAAFHRVAIIGSRRSAERLEQHMRRASFAGYAIVGVYEGFNENDTDDGLSLDFQSPAVVEALVDTVYSLGADTIALASGGLGSPGVQRLSWRLEGTGITLLVAPDVADIAGPRILVRPVAGLPLLHIAEPEFQGAQRVLKEAIDRVGAGLLLLLLSPLMATIALVALVSQGRPILYRQERVGRYGLSFDIHKFRTMRNGADREVAQLAHLNVHSGELFKIRDDPRVTRLGRVLRRFSLDELPQLWDVLRGWMSLVGPRPPLPHEVMGYHEDACRRLLVKPGITGLWQVSGRSDLSWEEAVRLDLHYVENWSVGLDISLLCRTLIAVITSRGAY